MFYGEFNDEKVCSEFHMCHDAAKIEYMKQSSCGESRLYKKGITDVIGWLQNYVACIKYYKKLIKTLMIDVTCFQNMRIIV